MLSRSDMLGYQLRGVEHIKNNECSASWLDLGLGKTVVALTAFAELKAGYDANHALVAAPMRVARDVWIDEIETWAHLKGLTASRIIGTERERIEGLRRPADIHLINRENVDWLEQIYIEQVSQYRFKQIKRWPWDMVFLDESQSFKNQSSSRWQSMDRICRFFRPRVAELTGTPASNGYGDLWGQMFLLDQGERLGRTETAYRDRWFDPPPDWGYGWTLKAGADVQIQAAVADIVVSMKAEDHLTLPAVKYNPIRVRLPGPVLERYKRFERSAVLRLGDHTITAVNAGVLCGKLLQAANGALYTGEGRAYEVFHNLKVDALLETLEGLSGPVLIGYGFVHDLDRIGKALTKFCRGRRKQWEQLKSAASMRAFKSGLVDYGVIHPASAGHGLNDLHLSGAEQLVWFGLTNNLELWDQLNARLIGGHRRIGKNCVIHSIVACDTWDEVEVDRLVRKDRDQVGLIRALRRNA